MQTKTLLISAIMLVLPFGAMADYTFTNVDKPGRVDNNENVTKTMGAAPYILTTITNDDSSHVASTSYVKGAYNELIAGMNSTYFDMKENKQDNLIVMTNPEDDEYEYIEPVIATDLNDVDSQLELVNGMAVKNALDSKRVEVWTTWDNDNAKTEVAFVTASAQ